MRVRHLAGAAAVAALAAVAVPGALVTPASAATPGYVGIVIVGAGEHAGYCVRWHSGITGDEILNDVAAVRYRSDGLILTINGQPASGSADNTHYWSYWEDPAGSWQYSSYGPSGTHPAAGTVEGWSYDSGGSSAPSPQTSFPAGGLYASMCGHLDVPVPAPHPVTRSAAPARNSVAAPRTTAAVAGTSTTPAHATSPGASSTSRATSSSSAPHASSSSDDVYLAAQPRSGDTASAAPTSSAAAKSHSDGSAWPTVIAVVLGAAVLGGAGVAVWWRRRPV